MDRLEYRLFYNRNLPHYQPPGAALFITFRLADSLPQSTLHQLRRERLMLEEKCKGRTGPTTDQMEVDRIQRCIFGKWDTYLAKAEVGPQWLCDDKVASIVAESIQFGAAKFFDLDAYCIMPNHVHLVCTPRQESDGGYPSIAAFMHTIKRHSASQANRVLNRHGAFWQHESYDRVIRSGKEMERVIRYVLRNPVSAGLVQAWEDWAWTYLGERWREGGQLI